MKTIKKTGIVDDAIKILAARYAKGEISEEEFEKKMANLKNQGLVK